MFFKKFCKHSDERAVCKCGDNSSDSYANKALEQNEVEQNAEDKKADVICRFDLVDVFAEMARKFLDEKFVSGGGNICVKNAGNSEGTA